ncbi:MAG: sulfite exporter TauE/SafE family protein [Proteobacteria bacterium]|nr:sulfite exporter TauE/SafE family protein [Pseudomonadota bacterium]
MQTYFWVCLILFVAGVTHGMSGFGSVLLSIPLLAIFLDIKIVIPLANLAAVSMTVMVFIQLRHQFDWKKIYTLIAGAIPGIAAGVFFLKRLDQGVIHWILGVILIGFSLYSLLLQPSGKKIRAGWAYPFGFLAGCLGGAFSTSGPPVIVYTSLQAWSKDQIKVTLQGFFFLSGLLIAVSHTLSGLVTFSVMRFYAAALPILILGTYLGSRFYGFIREEDYRKIVLLLLAGLGGLMIYKA